MCHGGGERVSAGASAAVWEEIRESERVRERVEKSKNRKSICHGQSFIGASRQKSMNVRETLSHLLNISTSAFRLSTTSQNSCCGLLVFFCMLHDPKLSCFTSLFLSKEVQDVKTELACKKKKERKKVEVNF